MGINLTPEIVRACNTAEVSDYLAHLATLQGTEVVPRQLVPPFEADRYFKWAHPVPDTMIYVSLTDPTPPTSDKGAAAVQVHSKGPNLGSAGGPTLQPLGDIALVHYQGLLTQAFRKEP